MIVVLDSVSLANKQKGGVGESQSNRHFRISSQPTELVFVLQEETIQEKHGLGLEQESTMLYLYLKSDAA